MQTFIIEITKVKFHFWLKNNTKSIIFGLDHMYLPLESILFKMGRTTMGGKAQV